MFGIMPFNRREDNPFAAFDKFFSSSAVDIPAFRTDIRNEADRYVLEAELPGVQKEDIRVDLKEGILTIHAESKEESGAEDSSKSYLRRERRYGSFTRSFDASGIDEEGISAAYENGILKLTLPKIPPIIPETRQITIS